MLYNEIVVEKTKGAIRTFLDSIQNNNQGYRSLHNLTQQIEHQYSGRFLIELLQNAHDALLDDDGQQNQRAEFFLSEDEGDCGVLYVANDGKPFSNSNFNALVDLGLSDKDPEISIGNKGIGFRSVLGICKTPEIYSRSERSSLNFDGFCFSFNATHLDQFINPILQLIKTDNSVKYPIGEEDQLTHWSNREREMFQDRCSGWNQDRVKEEISYLSPYSLPFHIENKPDEIVKYEQRGFVTVIRLTLKDMAVKNMVREMLQQVELGTILFLNKLHEFHLKTNGSATVFLRSTQNKLRNGVEGSTVVLKQKSAATSDETVEEARYYLWEREFGGENNPIEREQLSTAVMKLPGKWPKLKHVSLSIATPLSPDPTEGMLHIFLPTNLGTGCHSHFSAPFYGDMSRTAVDFSESNPYNRLLLQLFADTTLSIIKNFLINGEESDSTALLDLLVPTKTREGEEWWLEIEACAGSHAISLQEKIVLDSAGRWVDLNRIRLFPEEKSLKVFTAEQFKENTSQSVPGTQLNSRTELIWLLADSLNLKVAPSPSELADALERFATTIHSMRNEANWNAFWEDVDELFNHNTNELIDRLIILGMDGELHAVSDDCSVYFSPRSLLDTEETEGPEDVKDIPLELRPHIAFLSDRIDTTENVASNRKRNTKNFNFLSQNYIEPFSVEPILRRTLRLIKDDLPVKYNDPKSRICGDLLIWGLELLEESRSMDSSIQHLKRLPVPCVGGWHSLSDACFGKGWSQTNGELVERYLREINTDSTQSALNVVLLSPDHSRWEGRGQQYLNLLLRGGVMDGLPLQKLTPEQWSNKFAISSWSGVKLPDNPPLGYSDEIWSQYVNFIHTSETHTFDGSFLYVMENIFSIPGLELFHDMSTDIRILFTELILKSLIRWDSKISNWQNSTLSKKERRWDQKTFKSPIYYFLMEFSWLCLEENNEFIEFSPGERWYIPLSVIGINWQQFRHLNPYPEKIARFFEGKDDLIRLLGKLNMPSYETRPEITTDNPRLLNDLATSIDDESSVIVNKSIFIGQVRLAWRQFQPHDETPMPSQLIVRDGLKQLISIDPCEEVKFYLPNASQPVHDGLRLNEDLILEGIRTNDARNLRDHFLRGYDGSVLLASDLKVTPIIDHLIWKSDGNEEKFIENYPHLPIILLAIFAFYGDDNTGISKTFIEAMNRIRGARIKYVDSLHAGLWRGKKEIAKTEISSMWVGGSKSQVILARKSSMGDFGEMANALSSLLRRNDLEIPLQQFFSKANSETDDFTADALNRLSELKITEDHIKEIRSQWLGDLEWMTLLCRLVISHFDEEADVSSFADDLDVDELEAVFKNLDLGSITKDNIFDLIRETTDLRELGLKLFDLHGDKVELRAWNSTLQANYQPRIENRSAKNEFDNILAALKPLLLMIVAKSVSEKSTLSSFKEISDLINALAFPVEFGTEYWEVKFKHVIPRVLKLLEEVKVDGILMKLLSDSSSVEQAQKQITSLVGSHFFDPLGIHSKNVRTQMRVMETLSKIAIVWSLKSSAEISFWEKNTSSLIELSWDPDADIMFLLELDESKCLSSLNEEFYERINPAIKVGIINASDLKDLESELQLSKDDFKNAESRLSEFKKQKEIEKNEVTIAGSTFYNIEQNYSTLFDLLKARVDVGELPEIDIDKHSDLGQRGTKSMGSSRTRGEFIPGSGRGRISNAMRGLTGLIGEIQAYRMLQKKYGLGAVTSNSWKSSNSLHVFPSNKDDDGFGCDFEIHKDGKTYYIEVKSTQGSDTIFEMGSSEIELALDKANRRKETFKILHITNVLSDSPQAHILPNPYEKKYRDTYSFQDSGLRVRYWV
jgi:hypothetical protein